MQRPFVWTSAALICGAASSSLFPFPTRLLPPLFLLAWILSLLLTLLGRRKMAVVLLLTSTFLLGACLYLTGFYKTQTSDQLAQQYGYDQPIPVALKGVVTESSSSAASAEAPAERVTFVLEVQAAKPTGGGGSSFATAGPFQLAHEDADWLATRGRTLVNWYEPDWRVQEGDVVETSGRLRLLKGFKNPDMFDYEEYQHARGIYTRMVAKGPQAVVLLRPLQTVSPTGWKYFVHRKGMQIISRAARTEETRAFLCAILLGERSLLTEDMKSWFRETGTFHILAISGLHVGLVYLIISLSLSPLLLGMKARAAISIVIVWVYAMVAGAGVPVTRASIMLTLVLAGYLLDREGDFLTAIAAAAFILIVADPISITDASFQLSFSAVALLCVFEPLFSDNLHPLLQQKLPFIPPPLLHKLAVTLFASIVVGIGLMPIVAYHFNQASLIFPVANLLVIPLLSVALALGFLTVLAGFVSLHLAAIFGVGAEMVSQAIFAVLRMFSALPFSSIRVGSPPLIALVLAAGAIAFLWWEKDWKRKIAIFGCCSVLGVASASAVRVFPDDSFRMTFFDVGDADSCLLEFPDKKTMLVDTGFSSDYLNCGEQLLAPFLWRHGIGKIDALVLTHPDSDHCGGASFLLENFRVPRLIVPYSERLSPKFQQIFQIAEQRGSAIEFLCAGDEVAVSRHAQVTVLSPPRDAAAFRSDNDMSLVLRVACRNLSALLTGDAEKEALRQLSAPDVSVASQILKAPHHGLKGSFNREFLKRVSPDVTVISGRPFRSNDSIERRVCRYSPFCRRVFSTERDGAVIIMTDGDSYRVQTSRLAFDVFR